MNVPKPLLRIAHTKRSITLGTDLSPLKLLNTVNKPIDPATLSFLGHHTPPTARPPGSCNSPSVHLEIKSRPRNNEFHKKHIDLK